MCQRPLSRRGCRKREKERERERGTQNKCGEGKLLRRKKKQSVMGASVDAKAEGDLRSALRASIRRASVGLEEIDKARVVPISRG